MAGFPIVWASLALPTCRRSGPASTRCSAFLRNNRTHIERVSVSVPDFPARKRNFCGGTEGAETISLRFKRLFAETKCPQRISLTYSVLASTCNTKDQMEREITKCVGRRHVDSSARYPIRRRRVSYKQCSQIGLCPLWVISGHFTASFQCLLCPRKQASSLLARG